MTEEKKLTVNDRGVFNVRTTRMSPRGILHNRARIQSVILYARERLTYWQAELKACEAEPVLPEHQTNVAGLGFSQEELQKYIPQFRTINVEPQETPETTKSNLTCPKCGYTYTQQEFELLVKEAMQNRQVEAERPKP